ncbi:WxL domain-containing protein [Enterococcus faecium]|uniref:WxL domain-containing protein n=1 Tax=Enterococcus faecium TaxID=1352 RepID=UPI000A341F03|nr:WxL domain-containing protein [Enterococcus faecium]NTM33499.1 WxL domain-containing protein [Enterococcus faecium]OTO82748.1 hypothetical protein A5847_002648 [Enterococcus faecium]
MKKHVTLFSSVLMMSTTLLGTGGVFAATSINETNPSPESAQTPVSTELTINETPTKPVAPTDPSEGGGDKPTEITGTYGIAYIPDALTGRAQLNDNNSQQEISLENNKATTHKYNVGVQDKTRKKDQRWSLKASLNWDGDSNNYMAGTTITASNGKVMENNQGQLQELNDQEVINSASSLTISQSSSVEVMKANNGKTMNGVYNYQFEAPKLVIPNPEKVAAGTYSGNINWNLENAPA